MNEETYKNCLNPCVMAKNQLLLIGTESLYALGQIFTKQLLIEDFVARIRYHRQG